MKKLICALLLVSILLSMAACGTTSTGDGGTTVGTVSPSDAVEAPVGTAPGETEPAQTEPTEPAKSEAVLNAEALIAAIGEVCYNPEGEGDSWNVIMAAQDAYNALSAEEKAQVENAADLTAANNTYIDLGYQQYAGHVDSLILNMGEAKLANKAAILEALEAYNGASKEVKAHIQNYEALKSAAHTVGDLMLSKMQAEEDFVRGMNFYYPSAFPRGDEYWYADVRCFVLPYIGKDSSSVWLRLVCNYTSSSWVFFEKITYAVDDQRYYDYFSYWDVTRDNDTEVWEYVDLDVYDSTIEMLWQIVNSTKTVIRFEGDDYYHDFTVSADDKAAIREVLEAYELLSA